MVSAGSYKYGLVVDQLHDSEEIVVKPVGRHLKKYTAYAGAIDDVDVAQQDRAAIECRCLRPGGCTKRQSAYESCANPGDRAQWCNAAPNFTHRAQRAGRRSPNTAIGLV